MIYEKKQPLFLHCFGEIEAIIVGGLKWSLFFSAPVSIRLAVRDKPDVGSVVERYLSGTFAFRGFELLHEKRVFRQLLL